MKCPHCKALNKDEAKFCKSCGKPLNQGSLAYDDKFGGNKTRLSKSQVPTTISKGRSKNTIIICITVIICILLIAGAFVFINGNNSSNNSTTVESSPSESSVNTTSSSSSDSSSGMSFSEATSYLPGASSVIKQNCFDECDSDKDGVLTGSEITKFKNLADLTLRTAQLSFNQNVEATDLGLTGHGTCKTRYCTTHGRIAIDSNNKCPYCLQAGLDARTAKDTTKYL